MGRNNAYFDSDRFPLESRHGHSGHRRPCAQSIYGTILGFTSLALEPRTWSAIWSKQSAANEVALLTGQLDRIEHMRGDIGYYIGSLLIFVAGPGVLLLCSVALDVVYLIWPQVWLLQPQPPEILSSRARGALAIIAIWLTLISVLMAIGGVIVLRRYLDLTREERRLRKKIDKLEARWGQLAPGVRDDPRQ